MTRPSQLLPGLIIDGKYKLIRELGRGGMGVVFVAEQLATGRQVALKTLLPMAAGRDELRRRFDRELSVVCQLSHPNTITVYDAGSLDDGTLYFAMELLEGEPLAERLERTGPMSGEATAEILTQILKSLTEAHAKGIIHRDLKPDNIFLCALHGDEDFVKVLDFGIAKPLDETSQEMRLTRPGATFGTPRYMAPEQLRNEPLGPPADIYALGHTAYEMLTGRPAFDEPTLPALIARKLGQAPPTLPPEIAQGPLGPIITRATDPDPAARYPTCQAMLADLEAQATPRVAPPPPGASRGLGRWVAVAAALGVLVIIALFAAAGAWFYFEQQTPAPTAEAPTPSDTIAVIIRSRPSGAEVFDGDERLGTTPLELAVPRKQKRLRLTLRKDGYEDARLRERVEEGARYHVQLDEADPVADKSDKSDKSDKGIADKNNEPDQDDEPDESDKDSTAARANKDDAPRDGDARDGGRDAIGQRTAPPPDDKELARRANDAQRKINEARQKNDEARQKTADAQRQAQEARRQAADARRKAEDARRKAADARRKAEEARRKAVNPF